MKLVALFLSCFAASACTHDTVGGADAAVDASVADGAVCAASEIPIVLDKESPTYQSIYVQVTYLGASAALLVDTGSELTFIQEPLGTPDGVPDAGTIQLGCETLTLIGRPEVPLGTTEAGLPVVGTFGTDRLLAGPSKVDFANTTISLHAPGVPFPEAVAWPQAPFDVSYGIVLPHVAVGGSPMRLEVDTGSSNVVLVGQDGQPGDTVEQSVDAAGNPITIYTGTCDLTLGTWEGTVACQRIPTWPYFEQNVSILGGNIQGLIGISALGQGFVFDTDAHILRVNE